jgi:hypothetical protein
VILLGAQKVHGKWRQDCREAGADLPKMIIPEAAQDLDEKFSPMQHLAVTQMTVETRSRVTLIDKWLPIRDARRGTYIRLQEC